MKAIQVQRKRQRPAGDNLHGPVPVAKPNSVSKRAEQWLRKTGATS